MLQIVIKYLLSQLQLRVVRAVAVLGGLLQIFLFMCLCGITVSVRRTFSIFLVQNAFHLILKAPGICDVQKCCMFELAGFSLFRDCMSLSFLLSQV